MSEELNKNKAENKLPMKKPAAEKHVSYSQKTLTVVPYGTVETKGIKVYLRKKIEKLVSNPLDSHVSVVKGRARGLLAILEKLDRLEIRFFQAGFSDENAIQGQDDMGKVLGKFHAEAQELLIKYDSYISQSRQFRTRDAEAARPAQKNKKRTKPKPKPANEAVEPEYPELSEEDILSVLNETADD